MTSSVQVYNLFHNIQEDDLQHLELFTEYGQLALEQSGAKPFQKLLFLIRDFRYPDEFSYGLAGGEEFLGEKLQASDTSIKELTRVRANIRRVFESLDCFLMPYPGEKVASTKAFDGKLQDINEAFLKELQVLVPYLLRPENLEIKESNGQAVTGKQLMEYFRAYVKIFTSGGLPEPGSIWEATAEANHQAAASAARDHYLTNMNTAFGTNTPAVSPSVFDSKQAQVYKDAMAVYHGQKKMGSKEFGAPFLTKLEETLTNMASSYKNVNAGKLQAEKMAREAKETQLKIDALNEKYKEEQRKREEELKARTAMGLARDHYMTKIERQFGTATNYIDPKYLQQKHNEFLQEAEAIYRKEGGDMSSAAIATFRQELNRVYQHNVQLNVLRKSVTDQKDSAASLKTQLERMNEQHEALLGELRELKSNQSSSGGFWKVLGGILGGAAMVAPFLG
ncbi:Atlastin-1 [Halotydeus destructor]|nr:Atlastin-1 [Halotydeus destructor]